MTALNPTLIANSLENLDSTILDTLEMFNVPGAAIGVVVNDQIVLKRGYGIRDLNQKKPVTENTLFSIGSCTKAFTSFLLGQLVDEGKVSLDDPVVKYIPEFKLFDENLTNSVTIRDLLAHRTGIPRHDAVWFFNSLPRSDILNLLPYFEPVCGLRENFQYNNFMYSVAGLVIEKLRDQTWEEAITSYIFSPLNMTSSKFFIEDVEKNADFSFPYAEIDNEVSQIPFHNPSCVTPGGGIYSNINDMSEWVCLQLSGHPPLIKKPTLAEMHHIQMPFASSNIPGRRKVSDYGYLEELGYGLGWLIGSYRGNHFINHSGIMDGFFADVSLLPEKKIGIVILTNSSNNGLYFSTSMRNMIFDKLLGAEEIDWRKEAQVKYQQAKRDMLPSFSNEKIQCSLEDYIGDFIHPAYGIVRIFQKGKQLNLSFSDMNFQLNPKKIDVFEGLYFYQLLFFGFNSQVDITFHRNTLREVTELHIPFEGFRFAKPIVFKKH